MAKDYTQIFNTARIHAEAAGEEWMKNAKPTWNVVSNGQVVGQMLDLCGRWYVQTKLNTSFGRWWKKYYGFGSGRWLHFGISLEARQEMGLHEAMAKAAKEYLESQGVTGLSLYSWID